jgi:TonB family protein
MGEAAALVVRTGLMVIALAVVACANQPTSPSVLAKPARPDAASALSIKKWKFADFFQKVKRQVRVGWNAADLWRSIDPDGKKFGTKERYTLLLVDLDRDGRLVGTSVQVPSGVGPLDDLGAEAFRKGAPFLDPPRELLGPQGSIRFRFGFSFEIGAGSGSGRTPRMNAGPTEPKREDARARRNEYLYGVWSRINARSARETRWPPLAAPAPDPASGAFANLTVTVTRDGAVVAATISTPSGVAALDELAPKVIRDAAPFPQPPLALLNDSGALSFDLGFVFDRDHADPLVVLPEVVLENHAQAIRHAVEGPWAPPRLTPTTRPTTTFRVRTTSDGAVTLVELVHSSGDPGVDEMFRRALREAAPFPATIKGLAPILSEGVLVELVAHQHHPAPPDAGADASRAP